MFGRNLISMPPMAGINAIRMNRFDRINETLSRLKNLEGQRLRYAEVFGDQVSDVAINMKDADEMGVINKATAIIIFNEDDEEQSKLLDSYFVRLD